MEARFSNVLSQTRAAKGITVAALARMAKVSKGTISKLEGGTLHPRDHLVRQLANLMGADPETWLMAAGYIPEKVRTTLMAHPGIADVVAEQSLDKGERARLDIEAAVRDLLASRGVEFRRLFDSPKAQSILSRWTQTTSGAPNFDHIVTGVVLISACKELVPDADWSDVEPFVGPFARLTQGVLSRCDLDTLRAQLGQEPEGLGPLLEAFYPRKQRYQNGQYHTPPYIASFMGALLGESRPKTVFDPGVGAGVLLMSVRATSRYYGIDTDPLSVAMARANMALHRLRGRVALGDFLADRSSLLSHDWPLPDETFNGIICNPPYVRHHLIDKHEKKRLGSDYSQLFDERISGLATSYVYFFLEAIQRLSPGGVFVFITPAEFLDVNYGVALKRILLRYALSRMVLFDVQSLAFPDVLTTSCITVLQNSPAPEQHRVTFVEADVDQKTGRVVNGGRERSVKLDDLDASSRWSLLFGERSKAVTRLRKGRNRTLADYARVRRGIATGHNAFFALTEEEAQRAGIEKRFLVPVVASARDVQEPVLGKREWDRLRRAGRRCWLFYCHEGEGALRGTKALAYINSGAKRGVPERYLCAHRTPWYSVEQVDPPDIIVTYMSRNGSRFACNPAGCRVLSVFLNLYVLPGVDPRVLRDELSSETSKALLGKLGRTYGGGLGKTEPGELLKLPLPELPKATQKKAAGRRSRTRAWSRSR